MLEFPEFLKVKQSHLLSMRIWHQCFKMFRYIVAFSTCSDFKMMNCKRDF